MGLWGAAQALAFGGGGLAATTLSDTTRHLLTFQPAAYALVFACQAGVFLIAARLAAGLDPVARGTGRASGRIPRGVPT